MEPVGHPTKGHIVVHAEAAQRFLRYIREMDNVTLLRHAGNRKWFADQRGWAEFVWYSERCREELERRKLSIG